MKESQGSQIIGVKKTAAKGERNEWISPLVDNPDNGEIVVIACNVDEGQILQTAIYEQKPDDKGNIRELWHCGQPFTRIRYWLRLPAVPADSIISLKGGIVAP